MWPFTPLRTYVARSVPVIEAAVLNAWQALFGDLAVRTVRQRPRCYIHSYDGAFILVEYVRGAFVVDTVSAQWVCVEVPEPLTTITVSNLVPAAGSFAASTWYYIYLRSASRVPSFVISTTAPSTDRLFGADTTYRYLGCFLTNGSGAVIPYSERDGRFFYTGGGLADLDFDITINGNTWTNLGSTFFPPKVRRGTVRVQLGNTSTLSTDTLQILPNGISGSIVAPGTAGKQIFIGKAAAGPVFAQLDTRIEVDLADGPEQLQAKMLLGSGASVAVFGVDGFEDW